MTDITRTIDLNDLSSSQLKTLLGEYNNHLRYIQDRLDVQINQRQAIFTISGSFSAVECAELVLTKMAEEAQQQASIAPETLHLIIQSSYADRSNAYSDTDFNTSSNLSSQATDNSMTETQLASNDYTPISLKTRKGKIIPRGQNQQRYVKRILASDVSFGVGPAGTGKTYLAVACAVDMLERNEIERILLVRPAVEAGEKLGFLPGDLTQKIDPYLRPLYDALYEMLGFEKVGKLLERQIIEVAPLAYNENVFNTFGFWLSCGDYG